MGQVWQRLSSTCDGVELAMFSDVQQAAIDRIIARYEYDRDEFTSALGDLVDTQIEVVLCAHDRHYFINEYVQIYDKVQKGWIPFRLWDVQSVFIDTLTDNSKVIDLKARQMGISWIVLAFGLHEMLFRPIAEFLIFSLKENEAIYLLGDERLRGMYKRLPKFLQAAEIVVDKSTQFKLSNGSVARAFSRNGGDGYAATLAFVDEADLLPKLQTLLNRVSPTVAEGGRLVMVSRADKNQPESDFKGIYKAAKRGANEWTPVFMPWHAHPERDAAWYESKCQDAMENSGSLDDVYEQYPATDTEALAPRTLDKRIPPKWIEAVYHEAIPMPDSAWEWLSPELAGLGALAVYQLPQEGLEYRIGADPAEGNPNSDDSTAIVVERKTGQQVAALVGKYEPEDFGRYIHALAQLYRNAAVMIERNNHGHAVIMKCSQLGTVLLSGEDGKVGWLSNSYGKTRLYDNLALTIKYKNCSIVRFKTMTQVQGIDARTLQAPDNQHDDEADGFALAQVARISDAAEQYIGFVDVVYED
jgi:hypothetical protein